jgi:two-component system cell cycle sensor histidine kinase/response regulator CckA
MKQNKHAETSDHKARILVVEDEAVVAKDIASSLKALLYNVVGICATGEDAIAKASSLHPDLILMDIRLASDMDGIEAAHRIHKTQPIPIIFLTAHADHATLSRAKTTAPHAYIVKPFTPRELEAALETALYRASMERKLNEQRLWFESALNCIGDAIIATDVHGIVTFINPIGEHLTGWKRDKAVGRELSEVFHTIDELTRQRVEAPEARALRGNIDLPEDSEDVLLISLDGAERPIHSTVSPINDAQGNLLGIVSVFRDLTARRQMERRSLNRQKMEALGKLSSNIAHDFNNIISLIAGYTTAMQEYLLPDTRAHDDVQRIMASVEHAGSLSKRILGVARASETERSLDIRPVLISDAVRSASGLLRGTLEKRKIKLVDRIPDHSTHANTDRNHFIDTLVDILLNSAEAMPDGGTITIDIKSYTLTKTDRRLNPLAKPGRYTVLRIRDTGKGMPKDVVDRIFEPFFTTKPHEHHVGLGLAVVYSTIQRYGGWIKVSSVQDKGTLLCIYLPEVTSSTHATHTGPAKSSTILIADDDEMDRKQLQIILKQANFRVITAKNGDEAIETFSRHPEKIDLLILDVIMPGKDGRVVFEEVMKINPAMPVIMLSGFSREYVRSYLPSGSWRFIQKPFEPDQVLNIARRLLDQKAP